MKKPYAKEGSMRTIAPFLVLLLAALALVLAAAAALSHFWGVLDAPEWRGVALKGEPLALETTPQTALQEYLAQKRRAMSVYEWVDRSKGLVRIPVEAAMEALATHDQLAAEDRQVRLMGTER